MKVALYYTEEIAWEQEVTIDEKELADWAGSKEITPDLIREFIVSDPEWHVDHRLAVRQCTHLTRLQRYRR